MTRPESAMILAAGFGTRMRPLTDRMPKPLLPVAGRTLIDRALDLVEAAGVGRAVVNLHYLGDLIRAHLAGRASPEIRFSDEQPEILDTGGGVAHALGLLGSAPFHCLNSDAVWVGPNPLQVLAAAWRPEAHDALLLLVPRGGAHAYSRPGDFFLDAEGGVPRRRGTAAEAPYVFSGAQILEPGVFRGAPAGAFSMNLIWDGLIATGRLGAVIYPETWVDVGTPEGLSVAASLLTKA